MKISDAVTEIGTLKPGQCSPDEVVRWLSECDGYVKAEILDRYESKAPAFAGYDVGVSPDTELLVPPPYDSLYRYWLEAKIDYRNGEIARYNSSITMYNTAYDAYARYYARTHMPKRVRRKYF